MTPQTPKNLVPYTHLPASLCLSQKASSLPAKTNKERINSTCHARPPVLSARPPDPAAISRLVDRQLGVLVQLGALRHGGRRGAAHVPGTTRRGTWSCLEGHGAWGGWGSQHPPGVPVLETKLPRFLGFQHELQTVWCVFLRRGSDHLVACCYGSCRFQDSLLTTLKTDRKAQLTGKLKRSSF